MNRIEELQAALQSCEGREKRLRAITRYSNFKVMYYRTNLWMHAKRVAYLVDAVSPFAQKIFPTFNPEYALFLSLVHDDAEMIMGDYQSANKSKMSEAQLTEIENEEERAIELLSKEFPEKIGTFNYRDTLLDVLHISSVEAKIEKYFDKFEGLAEGFHEVFGGNTLFAKRYTNEWGELPAPFEFYEPYFEKYRKQFPEMIPLLETDFPLYGPYPHEDWLKVAENHTPHTRESLNQKTGVDYYDFWKENLIAHGDEEEIQNLLIQTEGN